MRGRWGEITLKRLVELAGMSAHVDFTEQHRLLTDEGAIRPDMIVHMPERRDIVVDVKTPLDAYLSAVEAQSEEERARELKRHAQLVAARVRELASKSYWAQFEHSPDFVVLFLPGDQFLSAALQENPDLIDESLRQNVMLATPTSLVALLKAVAYGWKQTALAENAEEVRRLGEDMYKRLAVFAEHLARLGKALGGGVDAFNKAVGSLEQQVMPAARRFPELGSAGEPRARAASIPIEALTRTPRGAGSAVPSHAEETAADSLEEPYRGRALPPASPLLQLAVRAAEARDPLLGMYALSAEWRALIDPGDRARGRARSSSPGGARRSPGSRAARRCIPSPDYLAALPRAGRVDFAPLNASLEAAARQNRGRAPRAWSRARAARRARCAAAARHRRATRPRPPGRPSRPCEPAVARLGRAGQRTISQESRRRLPARRAHCGRVIFPIDELLAAGIEDGGS